MLLCIWRPHHGVRSSKGRRAGIQVRKIKRRACEYDYVEVMACPSACLNGGGQLPPAPGQTSQQLLEQLEQHYHDPQVAPPSFA